ncbi:NFACT RNA binding domain-containing protein [Desulfovibrio sp. OttesenSCG-928-M14]|nr:NFACT RNA binding domain-containing protein [Desulfovibrio sp. OttesenSCG-928-M14]
MDAHFFRILADELCDFLAGARVEKIHAPLPGLFTFSLFARGHKLRLVFRHERKAPLLFFAREKLPNPARPPAAVMRLRKYCANRRLDRGRADYANRRLLFPVPAQDGTRVFLLLDMVQGAFVTQEVPEGFDAAPAWPEPELVDTLCQKTWNRKESQGPWQEFALLTPLLRESLAELAPEEGRALLVDLEAGGGDVFLYADRQGRALLPCAWPLPEALCARRNLDCTPLPFCESANAEAAFLPWLAQASEASVFWPDYPALVAACLAWEQAFFQQVTEFDKKETDKPLRKAGKKQEKLLAKLEREEERLQSMLALRQSALALQAELWRYGAEEKLAHISLPDELGGGTLELDPLLTVRQNMTRLFKESARGARGLVMLRQRREALLAVAPSLAVAATTKPSENAGSEEGISEEPNEAPSGLRPFLAGPGREIPGVASFVSSDGFVILRGKNAGGNQRLLKIGSGHDLWLHVEQGPSAHAIIRRSHAAEEVPERSLLEAGALVAAKSRFKGDAAVDVMVALVRHVHPIKGAAPGTVRVDRVLRGIRVLPAEF